MSNSKRRKARKEKEQANKQSALLLRGAVIALVLVFIIAVVFFQMGQDQNSVELSEDGLPIWQTMELRDANTGEIFTLADFDDRDVVVKITSLF